MPITVTEKEWDNVRTAFATSIMVDTPLTSLAQNLEGADWPIKGKEETPSAYIDLPFSEVKSMLVSKGQPSERVQQLVELLRETLAFDTPFGDMVEQSAVASERDNPLLKNLARLEIPENYPIEFTALGAGTLEFCRLEKLATLGQFAVFAQNISKNVIVGGDFRGLLNALAHIDEAALAKFVPFRPGHRGLHFIEAVAQIVRTLPADQRILLPGKASLLNPAVREKISVLAAYFEAERQSLVQQISAGTTLSRLLVVLNDPPLEPAVAVLLEPYFRPAAKAAVVAVPEAKKGNWFSRLFSGSKR